MHVHACSNISGGKSSSHRKFNSSMRLTPHRWPNRVNEKKNRYLLFQTATFNGFLFEREREKSNSTVCCLSSSLSLSLENPIFLGIRWGNSFRKVQMPFPPSNASLLRAENRQSFRERRYFSAIFGAKNEKRK